MVPSSCRNILAEIVFVGPGEVASFTGAVKAVLGALLSINVEENLDIVFSTGVYEPHDLVGGAIHAANVRTVRLDGPVADWKADNFNFAYEEPLDVVFGNPSVPIGAHDTICLLGFECLAQTLRVHADSSDWVLPKNL